MKEKRRKFLFASTSKVLALTALSYLFRNQVSATTDDFDNDLNQALSWSRRFKAQLKIFPGEYSLSQDWQNHLLAEFCSHPSSAFKVSQQKIQVTKIFEVNFKDHHGRNTPSNTSTRSSDSSVS